MATVNPDLPPMELFNSPLESGVRSAALLLAVYPQHCDVQRLVQYDYLVVHSGDVVDGPASIHPATPHRSGELLVRRKIVEEGLQLMTTRSVVQPTFSPEGISYLAGEYAVAFLDAITTAYVQALRDRATWISQRFQALSNDELTAFMRDHWTQWGAEFVRHAFVEAADE